MEQKHSTLNIYGNCDQTKNLTFHLWVQHKGILDKHYTELKSNSSKIYI